MGYRSRSYSSSRSRGFSSSRSCGYSSRGGYKKSYNNTTRQTCAQRYSPTKTSRGWYDANGRKVRDTSSYFSTIEKNGKWWKGC